MDIESVRGMDLTVVFKVTNLSIATGSVFAGLTQLFGGIQSFFLGIFIIAFGGGIGLLEFKVPPQAYSYASFLFSFIGRGVFYVFLGSLISHGGILRNLVGSLIFLVGIVFCVLQAIPSISPPENMNVESIHIGTTDEDII